MIKAEILTDAGQYTVELPAAKTLKEGWELVEGTIRNGLPFEGDVLLVIGEGAKVKHIRIFNYQEQVRPVEVELEADYDPAKDGGPFKFDTGNCVYLNQKIRVKGQALKTDGKTYYLPMEVNGSPALDMLDGKNLATLLGYWRQGEGDDENSHVIVIPHAQLPDYGEALMYILDLINETQAPEEPKERNVKAWQGWKENE